MDLALAAARTRDVVQKVDLPRRLPSRLGQTQCSGDIGDVSLEIKWTKAILEIPHIKGLTNMAGIVELRAI